MACKNDSQREPESNGLCELNQSIDPSDCKAKEDIICLVACRGRSDGKIEI